MGFSIENQNGYDDIFMGTNNNIVDQIKRISLFSRDIKCNEILQLKIYTNPIIFLLPNGKSTLKNNLSELEYSSLLENGIMFDYQSENYYFDKYQWNSIPFIKKYNENINCSARITLNTDAGTILKNTKNISIYPKYKELINNTAELSQIKIDKNKSEECFYSFLSDIKIFNKRLLNNDKLLSHLNPNSYELLKNKINIDIIGKVFKYWGNTYYPALINLA